MTRKMSQTQRILLLPVEVADLFRVSQKTVTRWAKVGKIGSTKTLGGHHRFNPDEVRKLIELNYKGPAGGLFECLAELDALLEAKRCDQIKMRRLEP